MFGQFSTCDLVEFQRLLWSGGRRDIPNNNNNTNTNVPVNNNNFIVGQQQFIPQQPAIISSAGLHQQTGSVITANTNSSLIQNTMPVPRQNNFLNNQSTVSFTTQPTTRYIPNQPRGGNQITHHNTIQQPQHQSQPHFTQIIPLDLGKQAQEARAREMVPEFEEQYFIQTSSPTKVSPVGRGHGQSSQSLHRPQPHIPTSQAISDHLNRHHPQQDLIQVHRQRMMQEQQEVQHHSRSSKKSARHDEHMYETEIHEMEGEDNRDDEDYTQEEEEEEEDDEDEEYEEYEPVNDQGPWKCGGCRKIYKRKANFLSHQKACTKKEPVHLTQLQTPQQLQQQQQQQQQGPAFKCTLCQQCFLTDKTFQRHLKTHDKRQVKSQRELNAAISSITGSGMRAHQMQQQPYQQPIVFQFKCEFCTEEFAIQQQLKAHEELHLAETTLRCTTCDKPFLRQEEFNSHIKTHLTETVWKCTMCNARFDDYKGYKNHTQTHFPVVYKDPPPKPPEPEKPPEDKKDDDIIEMEVFEDDDYGSGADSKKSPGKSNGLDPKRSKLDDLAGAEWVPLPRPSTSKASPSTSKSVTFANKSRYATGSNIKLTGKAALAKEGILKRTSFTPSTSTPSTSSASRKIIDDDDDDIVILSAPTTPHRPIPIRVNPTNKKIISIKRPLPPNAKLPISMMVGKRPLPPILPSKRSPQVQKRPPPPKKQSMPASRGSKMPPVIITYKHQCIICKSYLPERSSLQLHILAKHCSDKSIEIKLLRLEDDPTLDLEILEDEESAVAAEELATV